MVAAYSYDALGRRIKETHGSATTDLYYSNQWQVLEQMQGSTVTANNVWSPVYVDALVLIKQIPSCGPTQLLYVQQDANWNVTAVVNSAGVQQRFVYTPFGVQTVLGANFSASGSLAIIPYASQGLRLDSVIGDYDNRGRVKDPVLERMLQGDPKGYAAGDSNLYRDEGNNPINMNDSLGMQDTKDDNDVFILYDPREPTMKLYAERYPRHKPMSVKDNMPIFTIKEGNNDVPNPEWIDAALNEIEENVKIVEAAAMERPILRLRIYSHGCLGSFQIGQVHLGAHLKDVLDKGYLSKAQATRFSGLLTRLGKTLAPVATDENGNENAGMLCSYGCASMAEIQALHFSNGWQKKWA